MTRHRGRHISSGAGADRWPAPRQTAGPGADPLLAVPVRNLVESILKASDSRLHLLDRRGVFVAANEITAQALGLSRDALIGRCVFDLVPPDVAAARRRIMNRVVRTGLPATWQDRRAGRWLSTTLVPVRDEKGRVVMVAISASDVTDRIVVTRKGRQTELAYRTLIEHSPGVTYVASADKPYETLYVSPQIEQMLGYRPEELLARPNLWWERLNPQDRPRLASALADGRRSGRPVSVQYRLRARDGRTVWCRDRIFWVRDAAGHIVFYQGLMVDLTGHIRLSDTIRKTVAANLHDEVGQTLALAKIKLDALCQAFTDASRPVPLAEIADLLDRACQDLWNTVFDLCPRLPQSAGLDKAIRQLTRRLARQCGVPITVTAVGLEAAPLDETAEAFIFRAIRELLMNAARHAHATRVSVILRCKGRRFEATVRDNGIGFDVEKAIRRNRRGAGGFGLYHVRDQLKSIGARLLLRSRAGEGTTATIVVPVARA